MAFFTLESSLLSIMASNSTNNSMGGAEHEFG